ncbi:MULTISPECIES: DoxX family protein [Acinetobacter]|jgi:putative oxidoreductase|uniref:DoxX family protein n=1 Tax=Acinetobacter TaxID=469 RepID=UPI0018A29E4C|nr:MULTISPECIES: DoxX family protein [Acinetobacter]MBF7690434.1 DoxX family protein [Acinetobacter pollinis]MBF7692570.1 DoxX family protein [Acinetobacter pollinis]MBF7697561.1 DoxX family protein [Acinetobacter pollinis]MBF7699614.1 DoxX family protein [Acinetobacter pollinis]WEV48223.1 DoxX family protein [Acinetobacter sp. ESL0695]
MNTLRYFDFGSSKSFVLLVARILLIVLFLLFGLPKITGFSGTVAYMASMHTPLPTVAAAVAVLMEVVGSILILIGFYTRPLAVIFALYTLGTAIIGHAYWSMTGDAVQMNMINFYKNVSIMGGFLLLAITGPGHLSLDRR